MRVEAHQFFGLNPNERPSWVNDQNFGKASQGTDPNSLLVLSPATTAFSCVAGTQFLRGAWLAGELDGRSKALERTGSQGMVRGHVRSCEWRFATGQKGERVLHV